MSELLSMDDARQAFKMLGELAAKERLEVELFLMGGAAILLGHPEIEQERGGLTHDVDAVFVKPDDPQLSKLRGLIGEVQQALGLPAGWLNDSVLKFVRKRSDGQVIYQAKGILVRCATDLQLLGSKLGLERRPTDLFDQKFMFNKVCDDLKPESANELWSWVEKYVPSDRLKVARLGLTALWSNRYGKKDADH